MRKSRFGVVGWEMQLLLDGDGSEGEVANQEPKVLVELVEGDI